MHERTDNHDEFAPPTYNEICTIINKLKTNKAAGTDNITGELIKHGGRTLKQKIHKLICNIWNCDRLNCNNYRPIILLNIAYKIYAILPNNRLSEIIEVKLGDFQMGFRPNRSTIDNIFMLRQIFEKCYEYNIVTQHICRLLPSI